MVSQKVMLQEETKIKTVDESENKVLVTGFLQTSKSELFMESKASKKELCNKAFSVGDLRGIDVSSESCKMKRSGMHKDDLDSKSFSCRESERFKNSVLGKASVTGISGSCHFEHSLFIDTETDGSHLDCHKHTCTSGEGHESEKDHVRRSKSCDSLNKTLEDSSLTMITILSEKLNELRGKMKKLNGRLEKDIAKNKKKNVYSSNANVLAYNTENSDKSLDEKIMPKNASETHILSAPSTSSASKIQAKTADFQNGKSSPMTTYSIKKQNQNIELSETNLYQRLDCETSVKSVSQLIKYFESLMNNSTRQNKPKYLTHKSKLRAKEYNNHKIHSLFTLSKHVGYSPTTSASTFSLLKDKTIHSEITIKRGFESPLRCTVADTKVTTNSDVIQKVSQKNKDVICNAKYSNKHSLNCNIPQPPKKPNISDNLQKMKEPRKDLDYSKTKSTVSPITRVNPSGKFNQLESLNLNNETEQTSNTVKTTNRNTETKNITNKNKKSQNKEDVVLEHVKFPNIPKIGRCVGSKKKKLELAEKAFNCCIVVLLGVLIITIWDFDMKVPFMKLQQLFR